MFTRLSRSFCCLSICCLLNLSLANVADADFVIDDFSAGSTLAQFGAGTANQTTLSTNIFGGARDTTLNLPDLAGSEFFGVAGFGSSGVQLAQGSNDQINGSFLYNDFGSFDITEGGQNHSFGVQITASDSIATIPNAFSIRITSGGTSSIVSFDVPPNGEVPTEARINFASFSGVDLTNIDSIELLFNLSASPGTDLVLGGFRTIPEPASGMIGLVFMLCLSGRRRRSE